LSGECKPASETAALPRAAQFCYASRAVALQREAPMYLRRVIRPFRILMLLACFACAPGCGQKGDLYLPDKLHASASAPQA
jgi:predicted small lipoprotein YifL